MEMNEATKLVKDDSVFNEIKDKAVSYKNGVVSGAVLGLFGGFVTRTGKLIWWVVGGGLLGGYIAIKLVGLDSKIADESKFTLIEAKEEEDNDNDNKN